MEIRILPDADAVASEAARRIAAEARAAVAERGRFVLALSRAPEPMLRALAGEDLPWPAVHVAQVDERIAPAGERDRNLTLLRESLVEHGPLPVEQLYAMPVEEQNIDGAADRYARTLARISGTPPVLDLVHLGLGQDGHTASLVPGDPVLNVERDVAVTGFYMSRRRMTLTYPPLDRARRIVWVVTGAEKAAVLARLLAADVSIPAARVRQDRSALLADRAAAARLDH